MPVTCIGFSDKACPSCACSAHSFEWWGSSYWCLLGALIPFWWNEWQNSSCYRSWSLPSNRRTPSVCIGTCLLCSTCYHLWPRNRFILMCQSSQHIYLSNLNFFFLMILLSTVILHLQCWFRPFEQLAILLLEMIYRPRYDLLYEIGFHSVFPVEHLICLHRRAYPTLFPSSWIHWLSMKLTRCRERMLLVIRFIVWCSCIVNTAHYIMLTFTLMVSVLGGSFRRVIVFF